MKFSKDWNDMYPDILYDLQIKSYEPGNERSPEHTRFGAFLWWLNINPSHEEIMKIMNLAEQEEDIGVRDQVLSIINEIEMAKIEVNKFYKLMGDGVYSQIYKDASSQIKKAVTESQFLDFLSEISNKWGEHKEIKLIACKLKNIPTGNNSDINLTCNVKREHSDCVEKILLDRENGKFCLSGYYIVSHDHIKSNLSVSV
jgi:hypothetical protein